MKLLKKTNLEKIGILSFLVFFIFTPLLIKIRVFDGVYVEPLLPLLILGTFIILLRKKDLLLTPKIVPLYYSLITLLLLSFVYGYFLTGSFAIRDLLRLVKYGLYFLPFPLALYAGGKLKPRDIKSTLLIFVLVGFVTAAASLLRIYLFSNFDGDIFLKKAEDLWTYLLYTRSGGFLGQALDLRDLSTVSTGKPVGETYGLYASVVLSTALGFVYRRISPGRISLFLSSLVSIIVFLAIFYSLSRGAVLVSLLVVLGWSVGSRVFRNTKILLFSLLLILLASVLIISSNPYIRSKFTSTISFDSGIVLDSSTTGRIQKWEKIFEFFEREPQFALFGVGYNLENLNQYTGIGGTTHSFFLDMWVRGGLIALALAAAVWFLLFRTVSRLLLSKEKQIQAFGFPLLGFALGWFILNLVSGEQFFSDAPMIAFWGVLGFVTALGRMVRNQGKRKVLITLTSSGFGGAPQVVYDLLSHLPDKRDFDFAVAAPVGGDFNKKFKDLEAKVYPVPLDRFGVRGFFTLLKAAHQERVDLIVSHGKGAGLYSRVVGFFLGIPVVHTIHGIHYSKTNPISRIFYLLSEKTLSAFTRIVINVSKSQEKEGLSLKLFPKRKSRVVTNGVDIQKFRVRRTQVFRKKIGIERGEFAVAMVARFDPPGVRHKGHPRFIGMIPDLIKEVPNLKVIFVGGGEGQEPAKRLAKELGVQDSVVFLDLRKDVPRILGSADAFVLPSYHEGLSVSVLEASAAGIPVVGSDVVGIRDAVRDGDTGFLIDFGNPREAVSAFKKLAGSPALRRRMGERGREFVGDNFSIKDFVQRTLSVYEEALSDD